MLKKRTAEFLKFEQTNRKSIASGQTVVNVIIQRKEEKKSAKGNGYCFIIAQTLNRLPVFVQFCDMKDENKKPSPFVPVFKKVKKEDNTFEEVPEDTRMTQKDGRYGVIIEPQSTIMVTSFHKEGAQIVTSGSICKLALIADSYNDNISYKASQIICETKSCPSLTRSDFNQYFVNTNLSVVPTLSNIDPLSFPESTDPKYYSRSFVLPLSDDTKLFDEVQILVDPLDPKRFWGKAKDDETVYVSVNTETGVDQVRNCLSVVFVTEKDKFFMKFGYKPFVWNCFGVTDVDKWSKIAGRMISNAVDWFVYGSSKLDDIRSLRTNAEADDSAGLDYGYGEEDDAGRPEPDLQMATDDGLIASTGYVSHMFLNLPKTIEKAGVILSLDFIEKHYGVKSQYTHSPETSPNPLNIGWRSKLERSPRCIFNLTELDDYIRTPFIESLKGLEKPFKIYGIFSVQDDSPYEQATAGGNDFEKFLEEKQITPSAVFVVI